MEHTDSGGAKQGFFSRVWKYGIALGLTVAVGVGGYLYRGEIGDYAKEFLGIRQMQEEKDKEISDLKNGQKNYERMVESGKEATARELTYLREEKSSIDKALEDRDKQLAALKEKLESYGREGETQKDALAKELASLKEELEKIRKEGAEAALFPTDYQEAGLGGDRPILEGEEVEVNSVDSRYDFGNKDIVIIPKENIEVLDSENKNCPDILVNINGEKIKTNVLIYFDSNMSGNSFSRFKGYEDYVLNAIKFVGLVNVIFDEKKELVIISNEPFEVCDRGGPTHMIIHYLNGSSYANGRRTGFGIIGEGELAYLKFIDFDNDGRYDVFAAATDCEGRSNCNMWVTDLNRQKNLMSAGEKDVSRDDIIQECFVAVYDPNLDSRPDRASKFIKNAGKNYSDIKIAKRGDKYVIFCDFFKCIYNPATHMFSQEK